MQLAVRWAVLSALLAGVPGLRLIDSQFPSHVIRGNSLNISCDYDANGQKIYQVKWYKDDHEFYSYYPGRTGRTYDVPGVNVNTDRSTSRSVLLEAADRRTEGMYGCEVTLEHTFDTVIASGPVTVVDLPQRGPVISGTALDTMDEGDRVQLNCTAYRSRPAARLTWYINGARSDDGLLRRYQSVVDDHDLETTTLGLDFRLRAAHFGGTGQLTLKCTAEIETVFYQSADVRIASRTMAMRARFGAASTHHSVALPGALVFVACYLFCLHGD